MCRDYRKEEGAELLSPVLVQLGSATGVTVRLLTILCPCGVFFFNVLAANSSTEVFWVCVLNHFCCGASV